MLLYGVAFLLTAFILFCLCPKSRHQHATFPFLPIHDLPLQSTLNPKGLFSHPEQPNAPRHATFGRHNLCLFLTITYVPF